MFSLIHQLSPVSIVIYEAELSIYSQAVSKKMGYCPLTEACVPGSEYAQSCTKSPGNTLLMLHLHRPVLSIGKTFPGRNWWKAKLLLLGCARMVSVPCKKMLRFAYIIIYLSEQRLSHFHPVEVTLSLFFSLGTISIQFSVSMGKSSKRRN